MKEETCENRIDQAMADQELFFEAAIRFRQQDEFDPEDKHDSLVLKEIEASDINMLSITEASLGISEYRGVRIDLSWGGPSSYIEAKVTHDDELIEAYYHFLDWYDGAVRKIKEGSYLWQYIEQYIVGVEV